MAIQCPSTKGKIDLFMPSQFVCYQWKNNALETKEYCFLEQCPNLFLWYKSFPLSFRICFSWSERERRRHCVEKALGQKIMDSSLDVSQQTNLCSTQRTASKAHCLDLYHRTFRWQGVMTDICKIRSARKAMSRPAKRNLPRIIESTWGEMKSTITNAISSQQ